MPPAARHLETDVVILPRRSRSCAATLGRSGPTTAGAGHPGTANAGDGALPGLAISAAGQPTFCAPRLSHTWVDTMQIAAVDTNNSSAAMWYTCGAGLYRRTRSTLSN